VVEVADAGAVGDALEEHAARVTRARDAVAARIAAHDGHVIDRIGTRVVAAFGAPAAVEQATRRALAAARAVHEVGAARVGVESGILLVDTDADPTPSLTGEAVGVAWRLAAAAPPGTTLLGPRVHAEAAAFVSATRVTLSDPDGEEVVAWELGLPTEAMNAAADFVGRVRELAALRAPIAALRARGGGWVDVVGVAGVGKSRLVRELGAECRRADVRVLAAGCVAIGEQRGFGPFADLLRTWAGIDADASGAAAGAELVAALRALAPAEHAALAPVLARFIGIESAERTIEGPALAALVTHACRRFLERVAATGPVVVVLEDLHCADASSLDLLSALAGTAKTTPLLFVVTRRPDPAQVTDALPEPLDRIVLSTLDADESARLVRALAGDAVPATHAARIAARTGGNPFFIEQVVRALDASSDPDVAERAIPETVQQLLLARVDALAAPVRAVLEAAAVTGPALELGVLAHVVDDPQTLDADVALLVAAGLLVRTDSGAAFPHALAHEAVYDGIPRRRRASLHARVADVLVALPGERRADRLGMLAYHFSRADRPLEAEEFLVAAGDEATRTAASDVALHYFREAARLHLHRVGDAGDPERKAELFGRIGLALFNRGRVLEAAEAYTRALACLGERASRSPWRLLSNGAVVAARLFTPWRRRGRAATSRDRDVLDLVARRYEAEITADPARLLSDTLEGLRRLGPIDPSTLQQSGSLYAGLAGIFFYGGISFAVGRRLLVEAARTVDDDPRELLRVRAMRYIHDVLAGDWTRAEEVDDTLLDQNVRLGQLWVPTTYLGIHAERRIHEGRFDDACGVIARIAAIERRYDYQLAKANRQAMTALLHLERGELEPAHDAARAYLRDHREDAPNVFALGILATIEIASGDLDAAAASLEQAARVVARVRGVPPFHRVPSVRAQLLLDLTRDGAHGRAVRPAVGLSRWIAWSVPDGLRLAAASLWRRGARRRAVASWSRAAAEAIRLDLRPALARVYRDVGRRLVGTRDAGVRIGDVDAAACPARAAALFAELGIEHTDRTP
jgi:tetratricopeptide (TPR) repeat protein/DNA-binding NarL/FixJ family response regulator